jgi:exodeoxyribonuclease VII large subunit
MSQNQGELFSGSLDVNKQRRIYTVSEITQDIKVILENQFAEVWIEGEVLNLRPSNSRHLYFTLKDQDATLPVAIFNYTDKDIKFKIENGLKLICLGKIDVYPPHGCYKLVVEKVEPKGIGSLQLALEQLKAKLEKEGMFAAEHKRPLPYLPSKIGVVTSSSGAAVKDILKVLDRRFSDVNIVIRSVQVQGDGAKEDIAQGIQDLNAYSETLAKNERIEVMIVGRGGGSMEDLWAFNEEIVARSIYNSKIPVISAVGHERDWTIADLVADVRAPTPSVAAELVIPKKEDLKVKVDGLKSMLQGAYSDIAENFQEELKNLLHRLRLNAEHIFELSSGELDGLRKKLTLLNPVALIEQHKTKLLDAARQIFVRTEHLLKLKQAGFNTAIEKLSSLSPLNILSRGYSITFKVADGAIVKEASNLKVGENIKTRLHKGEVISNVTNIRDTQ